MLLIRDGKIYACDSLHFIYEQKLEFLSCVIFEPSLYNSRCNSEAKKTIKY